MLCYFALLRFMISRPFAVAAALAVFIAAVIPRSTLADSTSAFLTGYPLLRQQHSLTCESAAASMGTRGTLSEGAIMAELPRDPNPNLGFRGNPDGRQGASLSDYGVYAAPISRALSQLGYATQIIAYGTLMDIRHYVNLGWPVEVWITYAMQRATPRIAFAEGEQFVLVPHEHTVLVVGYRPGYLIVQDPWDGTRVAYDLADFTRAWGYFGNMGVAIEPCPVPQPVANLHISNLSTRTLKFSWRASPAITYGVSVSLTGTGSLHSGTQSSHTFTIKHPVPGGRYVISVTAHSACGDSAAPVRLWAEMPGVIPTPTASPTSTPVEGAQPTSTPVPVSSGTPGVQSTETPAPEVTSTPAPRWR